MAVETTSTESETKSPRRQRHWPYLAVEPGRTVVEPVNLACRLSAPELRERAREIRETFVDGILQVEELEDGFVYWFDRSDEWFSRVTDFALYESRCCAFLDFEVGLQAAGQRISLRVSGPREAKRFLAAAHRGDIRSAEEVS